MKIRTGFVSNSSSSSFMFLYDENLFPFDLEKAIKAGNGYGACGRVYSRSFEGYLIDYDGSYTPDEVENLKKWYEDNIKKYPNLSFIYGSIDNGVSEFAESIFQDMKKKNIIISFRQDVMEC